MSIKIGLDDIIANVDNRTVLGSAVLNLFLTLTVIWNQ